MKQNETINERLWELVDITAGGMYRRRDHCCGQV